MQPHRTELYRETTPWAAWVYVLLVLAFGGSAAAIFLGTGDASHLTDPGRVTAAVGIVLLGALIHFLFGGLTVVVERDGIRAGLGRGWIFRTWIPFTDVEALESVRYSPIREFGGWGLRGSAKKRAWTARGNQAVVLTLTGERRVYLGSDEPSRLETRIRNAIGFASRV